MRFIILLILFGISSQVHAQARTIAPDVALKSIFYDSKTIVADKKTLTPEQTDILRKSLGTAPKATYTFYIAYSAYRPQSGLEGEAPTALPMEGAYPLNNQISNGGVRTDHLGDELKNGTTQAPKIEGYALIDNEVGKTEPITFLTAITPNGKIKAVEILAYREHIGGEVTERKFLSQYDNKTIFDPVRTGQDIQNITGATLSSRAISVGVKRALLIWNTLYGKN